MTAIVNFLSEVDPMWSWLLLGALLLGLEIVMPGVHFVWFGFAAIIVSIIVFATGIAWGWQLIAFALTAAAFVVFLRGYASPMRMTSDEPDLNIRGQQYVGRTALVEDCDLGRTRQGTHRRYDLDRIRPRYAGRCLGQNHRRRRHSVDRGADLSGRSPYCRMRMPTRISSAL